MKIVYYIGETVGADAIFKKGILNDDMQQMYIETANGTYQFHDMKQVDIVKIQLGTMIKVINGEDTIFLAVPRLFIDKGTGFLIANYFATKKAGRLLSAAMQNHKANKAYE